MIPDGEHVILSILVIFYFALAVVVILQQGHPGKVLYYLGAALLTLGVYIL